MRHKVPFQMTMLGVMTFEKDLYRGGCH